MRKTERGVALFIALIMSTIMFLIAGTVLVLTMTEIHLADYELRSTQAFYAAESSVSMGITRLRSNPNSYRCGPDYFPIGNNIGTLTVEYDTGVEREEECVKVRDSLEPAVYHLILRGIGTIPGSQSPAKRTVEQEITIKPFALFAEQNITLNGACNITGHVHANNNVTLSDDTTITGNVTAWGNIFPHNATIEAEGVGSPIISEEEPKIVFPDISFDKYCPTYTYNGGTYDAQLFLPEPETIVLDDGEEAPLSPTIEKYVFEVEASNPAGVFCLNSSDFTKNQLVLLKLNGGTLVFPPLQKLEISGVIKISAFEHFPAILSNGNMDMTLFGNLVPDNPEELSGDELISHIHGLLYSNKQVIITAKDTPNEILQGSIFAKHITLDTDWVFQQNYDPALFASPPPGITLIDRGEWREMIDSDNE